MAQSHRKIFIFSAPSGSGKTTIVNSILSEGRYPLEFSVSATSRSPRGNEKNGIEYYFLSPEEFRQKIDEGLFLEWEQVYTDTYYGTLRSELSRIWDKGNAVILDVDVMGGLNVKRLYPEETCLIFVMPPSVEELRRRLEGRGTDSQDKIDMRIRKAEQEMGYASQFDHIVVNDTLEDAICKARSIIEDVLK
ncbi:MAG: guanylate kinase [Flavobacteriales bacterium]|nr:guanylate kinase [Flavobacteriales bacterium]